MKKQYNKLDIIKTVFVVILLLPLAIAWIPSQKIISVDLEKQGETVSVERKDEEGNIIYEEDGVTPSTIEQYKFTSAQKVTHFLFMRFVEPVELQKNNLTKKTETMDEAIFRASKENAILNAYYPALFDSFKELAITLVSTLVFAMILSYLIGYVSVLSMKAGRGFSNALSAIESIPSILIALFCYAPVSGALAKSSGSTSAALSLFVFVAAATATVLPEAVRSISIPLSDLYNRKYSVSFRSYGFTKNRILSVLMKTSMMVDTLKRVAAGILLKTLVLDTSFGFVIQVGLGSTGTPQHTSPGALIAANRKTLLAMFSNDGSPLMFWLPSIFLITISVAFLIILNDKKEEA